MICIIFEDCQTEILVFTYICTVDGPTLTTLTPTCTAAGSTGSPGEVTSGTLGYTPSVTPSSNLEHSDNKSEG